MVEMDVGRDHQVDRVAAQPGGGERGEQARHRVVGAGVDEGGAAVLDDQVGGVEARAVKAGVDDVDAVRQRSTKSGAAGAAGVGSVTRAFRGASTIFEADSRERVRVEDNADGSEFDAANGDEIMIAIDRCARRVAVFLLLAAGLVACGTMAPGGLPLGTPIATARQSLIGPSGEYPLPGGGTRLEFRQGRQTYMLDFDSGGLLVSSQQVLTPEVSRPSRRA